MIGGKAEARKGGARGAEGGHDRAMEWVIDELVYAGPEHLDEAFVAGFDRKQGRPDPGPDLAILREYGVSSVVDLGAGTGRFALAAAAELDRVVAVDVSPAMIAWIAAQDPERRIECVRAGFLSYEHQGDPVDAVYTRHALHQLPDFWKAIALERVAAILRPGGILRVRDLIYDFEPGQAGAVFDRWFDGASADPAEGYTADDYAQHVRTEHSTFRWLFEPMLRRAGFEILTVDYEASIYGAYTCARTPPG